MCYNHKIYKAPLHSKMLVAIYAPIQLECVYSIASWKGWTSKRVGEFSKIKEVLTPEQK